MDVHLVVKYAVHHSKAVLAPSFFQCWPTQTDEQVSFTAGVIKVASNIAGTPFRFCWCCVKCVDPTLVKHIPQLV